jgi:SagB-type dehydrogenase family enzyme
VSAVGRRQTVSWLRSIYGGPPDRDDPAEAYHEASKVAQSQIGRQLQGAARLAGDRELQLSSMRAVKRQGVVGIPLPAPAPLDGRLGDVLDRRRSHRAFDSDPIADDALAALLHAGYGVTGWLEGDEGQPDLRVRAVPSAGALYPLEVYAAVLRVGGLEPGLYHFDPPRSCLELLRTGIEPDELACLSPYPDIVASCAALVFVAGIFGRTRFKYGLRGYRFALLEAGHVAQNVLLAATALGLAAVPIGGFYDRRTDAFLGLDGVNESTLYAIAFGREPT